MSVAGSATCALNENDMTLEIPAGYDYDLCSSDIVLQMSIDNGRLVLPSGMSDRPLMLPDTDRMTLPFAHKVRELVDGGARVIGGQRPEGQPGLDRLFSARCRNWRRSPRQCGTRQLCQTSVIIRGGKQVGHRASVVPLKPRRDLGTIHRLARKRRQE